MRGILKKNNNKYNCVVGDIVEITEDNYISKIIKRKNFLIRPIVSNVDIVAIQFSGKYPDLDYEKINILISNALLSNIFPIIIINKIDLLNENEKKEIRKNLSFLNDIGIKFFMISGDKKIGISELEKILKNKISVFAGPSGVGKSTVINLLQDEQLLKTGSISLRLKRGKHTTRDSNMLKLNVGGYIIDTPGFTSLDIPKIENLDLINKIFPEFKNYSPCKFLDCIHLNEPDCKIKEAVENGKIDKKRYEFYKKIIERWKS